MTFASRDVSQGFLDEAIARLRTTGGVAVDQDGYVYIGDQVNNRVRVVTPSGMMHTVAGTGVEGCTGDGGPAECAQMSNPDMIAFDH